MAAASTGKEEWGATPPLRRLWSSSKPLLDLQGERTCDRSPVRGSSKSLQDALGGYDSIASAEDDAVELGVGHGMPAPLRASQQWTDEWSVFASSVPGIVIAVILNMFLSISFGSAFFPTQWIFPSTVSRSLGVQLFLLSTAVGQVVMTFCSDFPVAIAMMMVENIPFMTTIALATIAKQGMGEDSFSTVFMANAIMSITVGVCFFVCGHFKLGFVLNVIPKSLILGCIGGIGVFIFRIGMEVSSNTPFAVFSILSLWPYWGVSALFEVALRLLLHYNTSPSLAPLLAPLYFCSIPFIFYVLLWLGGVGPGSADAWFFPADSGTTDPAAVFRLFDHTKVDWQVICSSIPTMVASTVFAFLHVPLNVPALKLTTGCDADIDRELKAHAYSNLLAGLLGQCQNYLCYSNSVLYFRCNGNTKLSSLLVAAISVCLFFAGPSLIAFVPRCMPGCLLIHIGIDLCREALYDSLHGFDGVEYAIILVLTVIMTLFGMTVGLIVGLIAAAVAFIFQTNLYIKPIRRQARCTTMRSSRWRSERAQRLLPHLQRRVLWIQLQGSLYFGNAQLVGKELDALICQYNALQDLPLLIVILDFSLVLSIDSSAVDAIKDIHKKAIIHKVALVYVRGSSNGFPCAATLTESLRNIRDAKLGRQTPSPPAQQAGQPTPLDASLGALAELLQSGYYASLYVVDDLNSAIMLAEERLLHTETDLKNNPLEIEFQQFVDHSEQPHLYQLKHIIPNPRILAKFLAFFVERRLTEGQVLWQHGEASTCAVLLVSGSLTSFNSESELMREESIYPGHLVGEFGLLKGDARVCSLRATQDSVVLELSLASYTTMQSHDSAMVILLNRICLAYLDMRTRHVSNFLLESRSLPV